MSKLHDALAALQPRDWSEIPQGEDLKPWLESTLDKAEFIVSSVPQPAGGSPFLDSKPSPHISHANSAHSASEMHVSSARSPDPVLPDLEALQKGWGKPIKPYAKDKENTLGVNVWKMAGHDRHGAWFARRSVHEGLGFAKWKRAMQGEFGKSLAISGGPGEGSVRGIGADRRLEREVVPGVGQVDVYQLSAQFPGPVAPREFITCLLTSDSALSDTCAAQVGKSKKIPRHYMVVSIPVDHSDAPQTGNLVRGHYESVEMIREIPLHSAASKSTPDLSHHESPEHGRNRGLTVAADTSDAHSDRGVVQGAGAEGDPEMNPVEWIMITRSDPGGGIPRFMVERGTPASIVADAAKFVDWAASEDFLEIKDEEPLKNDEEEAPPLPKRHTGASEETEKEWNTKPAALAPLQQTDTFEPSGPGDTGIIASLTNTVRNYTPNAVTERLGLDGEDDDDYSSSISDDSFDSARDIMDYQTAYEGPRTPDVLDPSSSSFSLPHGDDSSAGGAGEEAEKSSEQKHYDREIEKLARRRKTLDERLEKSREDEKKKHDEMASKNEKEQEKQRERIERDKKKQEDRYKREMEKLEQRKEKEEKRLEEKRRKARDKDAEARGKRERVEYGRRIEILERENELLRRQMGDLQRENTLLVQKVGKLSEGHLALRQVREEIAGGGSARSSTELLRGRASSTASKRSADGTPGDRAKSKLGLEQGNASEASVEKASMKSGTSVESGTTPVVGSGEKLGLLSRDG